MRQSNQAGIESEENVLPTGPGRLRQSNQAGIESMRIDLYCLSHHWRQSNQAGIERWKLKLSRQCFSVGANRTKLGLKGGWGP